MHSPGSDFRMFVYVLPITLTKINAVYIYVGHLESKERLRIQPAKLFNFS